MARRRQDPNVCGVTAAIAVIEGKRKTTLLWLPESGPQRPAEPRRRVPGLGRDLAEPSPLSPLSDWGHRRLDRPAGPETATRAAS